MGTKLIAPLRSQKQQQQPQLLQPPVQVQAPVLQQPPACSAGGPNTFSFGSSAEPLHIVRNEVEILNEAGNTIDSSGEDYLIPYEPLPRRRLDSAVLQKLEQASKVCSRGGRCLVSTTSPYRRRSGTTSSSSA